MIHSSNRNQQTQYFIFKRITQPYDILDIHQSKQSKLNVFNEFLTNFTELNPGQDFDIENDTNFILLRSGLCPKYSLAVNKQRKVEYNADKVMQEKTRTVLLKKIGVELRKLKAKTNPNGEVMTSYDNISNVCLCIAKAVFLNHKSIEQEIDGLYT
jgi:hypothetical protein